MNAYLYGFGPEDQRRWLMVDLRHHLPRGRERPRHRRHPPRRAFHRGEPRRPRRHRHHARARGPHRRRDRAVAAPQGADLCHALHRRHAEVEARRVRQLAADPGPRRAARLPLQGRPIRHRDGQPRALDPGDERARHPHAARHWCSTPATGSSTRRRPSARPLDEARFAQARRRRRAGARHRFHQRLSRGRLALRARRGPLARRHRQESAAPRRRHDVLLQRRARQRRGRRGAGGRAPAGRCGPRAAPGDPRRHRNRLPAAGLPVPRPGPVHLPRPQRHRAAVHRQPGRAARRAGPHRRGGAPGDLARQGRYRHLLLAHHPGQREGASGASRTTWRATAAISSPTTKRWCTSPAIRDATSCARCIAGCGRRSSCPCTARRAI